MVTTVYADTTALIEATAASDEPQIIAETLRLLGPESVPPSRIAGRVGLPALWGACDARALIHAASAGRVAEWLRTVPAGPEPDADQRRLLAPALPLVQSFLAISAAVQRGLTKPTADLPEPLLPGEIRNPDGALGELRGAYARRDEQQVRRVMLGYHATGADYRALTSALFATLEFRYPEGGLPVTAGYAAGRVLDMANWGGNEQALIAWLTPYMLDPAPDTPVAQAARAYAADTAHDLGWLRTRLTIPKDEQAGSSYQQALLAGDATAACEATLQALRAGATPEGVTAGMALAVATRLSALAEGDRDALMRAGDVLLYVHAVHALMTQVQDPVVWPLLYTAAAAVNSLRGAGGTSALESAAGGVSRSLLGGGLIAPTMLRTVEHQLAAGDAPAALATARRYAQMGHPTTALAGVITSAAALRDATPTAPESLRALPYATAAAEEYLLLPRPLQQGGQNALLTAAIRLASDLRGSHAVADRVRAAIAASGQG
ncbi:MAG TPA: hypothetical protein VFY89_09485 [Ktedonobacterales bacterium]